MQKRDFVSVGFGIMKSKYLSCFLFFSFVFSYCTMNVYGQNTSNKSGVPLAVIDNQRITVLNNGDVLSVSADEYAPHSTDTVVVDYNNVPVEINRDASVWKGYNGPSVFYFPRDKHLLIRHYRNNATMLAALDELVKTDAVIDALDSIEIIGACSPIGSEEHNLKLALSRCMALRSYLRKEHLEVAQRFPIRFSIIGIDTYGYNILKEESPPFTEEQIWNRLQYAAVRLKMKDGSYMIPGADIPKTLPVPEAMTPASVMRDTIFLKCDTVYIATTTHMPTPKPSKTRMPLYLAIKTNLLYDALLLPNLAVEWYMGRQWSLVLEGNWSWWTFDKPIQNLWYHRIQTASIELRRWVKSPYPLHGHALGVYSMIGNYDVRFFAQDEYTKGYLSHLNWSAGLSYAYSFPIARRLNMELALAVGYVGGRYYKYNYCTTHQHWAQQGKYNRKYFGPTRAGVSLVWLIGTGNDPKSRSIYAAWQKRKRENYIASLRN